MAKKVEQKYPKPFEKYYQGLPWWGKVIHWVEVVLALLAVVVMFCVAAYAVLFIFGMYGVIVELRDTILREIGHWVFG